MPRKSDPWAENVFMNVRLRTELFVRNEITNPSLWATRDLAKSSTQNWHALSPSYSTCSSYSSDQMSVSRTKRTSHCPQPTSAFGGKADIEISARHVCF